MSKRRRTLVQTNNELILWSKPEKSVAYCNYIDAHRHAGNCYKFSDSHTLVASQARKILFSIPSGFYIEGTVVINTTGATEAEIWDVSSYASIGTAVTTQTYNMNREAAATSGVLFYEDSDHVVGTIIDRCSSNSGSIFLGRWNFADNKKYMIRLYSHAASNYTAIQFMYIENGSEYELSSSSSTSSSSVGLSSSSSSVGVSSSVGLSSSSSSIGLSSSSSVGLSSSVGFSSSSTSSHSSSSVGKSSSSVGLSSSSSVGLSSSVGVSSSSSVGLSSSSSVGLSSSSSSVGLSSSSSVGLSSSSVGLSSSSVGLSSSSSGY